MLLLADSTVRDNTAVLSGAGISNSGIDTSFLEGPHQRARDGVKQFYTLLNELKNVEIPSFDMSFLIPGSFQEYVGNLAELPSHLNDPVQVLVDLYPEEVLIDVYNKIKAFVGASSGGGDPQIQSSALIVIDSTITRNVTGSKTSGIGTRGGGIHNDLGAVVVKGSTISNNSVLALAGGLGGGIENTMGVVAVFDTVLSGNTIETKNLFAGGGAVFNLCGVLWVDNADLMGNEAGAMYLSNGGAIFNMVGSSATVSRSTIADNRSGNGGGIANLYRSALTIEDSTIRDNSVSGIIGADGGGIKNAEGSTTSITRCTVSGNRAEGRARGGGIFNLANFKTGPLGGILYRESSVAIENSTISHNTVEGEEFWIITLGACGGGIYNGVEDPLAIASVSIQSSTIANNGASGYPMDCGTLAPWCMGGTVGGGLYNTDAPGFPNTGSFGPALMSIRNSLVIGNYPTNCDQHSETRSATFRGADNLESDGKCFAYSWKIAGPSLSPRFATPSSPVLLGPLDNNGGPTFTHALLNGSPGVDKGVNCPETDQRGIVRPDGQCDIGAFERSRPVGFADDYELFEGQPLTVGAEEGVKSNDLAMPDSTVIVQNPPMNGTLTLDLDGSFVYTPFSEYSGPDHFTYIVEDKEHLASDPTTVFLTVIPLLEVVSVLPGAGAVDVLPTPTSSSPSTPPSLLAVWMAIFLSQVPCVDTSDSPTLWLATCSHWTLPKTSGPASMSR